MAASLSLPGIDATALTSDIAARARPAAFDDFSVDGEVSPHFFISPQAAAGRDGTSRQRAVSQDGAILAPGQMRDGCAKPAAAI